ncbi:MAG: putative phage tail protein [Methanogenium sp.]|jgi:uncharacterized protein YmfQ (DUF2313 family)
MIYTGDMYLKLLQSLLPKGKLWNRNSNSWMAKVLRGFAEELSRVSLRAEDLFNESIPSRVSELIEEYEYDLGLYDKNIGLTTQERIASIVAKFYQYGYSHKEYFIGIAADLGYTITIEEFSPFFVGSSTVNTPIGPLRNIHFWLVWVTVEYGINYNIQELMDTLNAVKPAQTIALFDFKGRQFSNAFDCSFFASPSFDNSWGGTGYGILCSRGLDFGREFSNAFTNAYDYDGIMLTGAFGKEFSTDFDRYSGGAFSSAFDNSLDLAH